ncbi:MAG: hypothetical protein AAGE94_00080 [Acidobacteriota bacterium]
MIAEVLLLTLLTFNSTTIDPVGFVEPLRWTGSDARTLPFRSHDQILDYLRHADIVGSKELGSGSTKPLKLDLERDGIRAHAIFRHVDLIAGKGRKQFRDSHVFEVAAYETARLLGLDNVPPATLRTIDGREGSIQLWVENARSETERIEAGEVPDDPTSLLYQKHVLRVFDALIYNFDRNTGNLLLDDVGKLWFIDHTRSFKRLPALPDPGRLVVCERRMWQRLQAIDAELLRERLAPYLDTVQINAVVKRHRALVDHFEKRMAHGGEDRVLFDLL